MFAKIVNDPSRDIRMTIAGDATTWSITYNLHSDNSRGVIYYSNIFIIQATGFVFITLYFLHNSRMGPIRYSVTLLQTRKAFQGQTL
jgi:hypothetical protein